MTPRDSDRPQVVGPEGGRSRRSDDGHQTIGNHSTAPLTSPDVPLACSMAPLAHSRAPGVAQTAQVPAARPGGHEAIVFNQPQHRVVFNQPAEPWRAVGFGWLAEEGATETCECCGSEHPEECDCQTGECFDGCLFDDNDEASEDDEEDD